MVAKLEEQEMAEIPTEIVQPIKEKVAMEEVVVVQPIEGEAIKKVIVVIELEE